MINRLFLFLVIFSISYADLLNPEGNLRTVHVLFEWEQEPDAVSYNLRILLVFYLFGCMRII